MIKRHIKFSHNWNNKLNCDSYSSLRVANSDKYKIGELYDIYLSSVKIHVAVLIDIIELPSVYYITQFVAHLDTGLSYVETIQIINECYPDVDLIKEPFYLILLKVVK